jgi:hypothetical protein
MSKVGRDILLALVAAGVFAAVLVSYLVKETRIPEGPALVAAPDGAPRGPDTLALAQRAASSFVGALGAGDLDGAYAQMAGAYREAATPAAFRAAWKAAPLLASPRRVSLSSTRETSMQLPDGGFVRGATFTARGMVQVAAGALEVTFTFLREDGEARVLAVSVGGVPVIQGIATNH